MTTHTHAYIARSDVVGSLLRPAELREIDPHVGVAVGMDPAEEGCTGDVGGLAHHDQLTRRSITGLAIGFDRAREAGAVFGAQLDAQCAGGVVAQRTRLERAHHDLVPGKRVCRWHADRQHERQHYQG